MTTAEMIAVMQAYDEGKKIQCLIGNRWLDAENPSWDWFHYDFRVKPEEAKPILFMTNRQLAEWCAEGKGLWKHDPSNSGTVYHYFWFLEPDMDKGIPNNIVIMPFGSDEWIEPIVDIYERDCKGETNDSISQKSSNDK